MHLQFIVATSAQTDLINRQYNITSMTVSTGSSKTDPGEDLPLFIPLLRKLHLSQLQLAEVHFIANGFLHVPALKTQDSQTDDIEITIL